LYRTERLRRAASARRDWSAAQEGPIPGSASTILSIYGFPCNAGDFPDIVYLSAGTWRRMQQPRSPAWINASPGDFDSLASFLHTL